MSLLTVLMLLWATVSVGAILLIRGANQRDNGGNARKHRVMHSARASLAGAGHIRAAAE